MTERRLVQLEFAALTVVVLTMGLWPFLGVLDQWPWGADATKWLSYGNVENPTWTDWVFFHKHFIGYRPLTALTYVLNSALGGYRPFGYRLFDVVCHCAAGVGLWGVFRLWTGSRWAVLAPIAFFHHPAAETVVPYVSRRSYSLGLALGLAALASFTLWLRAPAGTRRGWAYGLLSTVLFPLGLFANETVYVLLPLMVFVALHETGSGQAWYQRILYCLPAWATGLVAGYARYQVLGKLGGYERYYFAYTEGGKNKLRSVADPDALDIFSAAWSYALFPTGASGQPSLLAGRGGLALLGLQVILAYYVWQVVVEPARHWRDPERRGVGVAGLWFGGLALLYALTGTWFWRQGYALAAPFALVWAWVMVRTVGVPGPLRRRLLHAAPQLGLLLSIGWYSPSLGLDPKPLETRTHGSHIVNSVLGQTELVRDGSVLWLALPARQPLAHIARIWITRSMEERDLMVKLLAVFDEKPRDPDMVTADVFLQDHRLRVELHPGMRWYTVNETALRLAGDQVWLDRIRVRGRDNYLVTFEGPDVVLRPIPEPPEGASEAPAFSRPARLRRRRAQTRQPSESTEPGSSPADVESEPLDTGTEAAR